MGKVATIFIIVMIFGLLIGNEMIQGVLKTIWLVVWGAFFLFLIIYYRLDHKKLKKQDKEG